MKPVFVRWAKRALVAIGLLVAAYALRRFPWQATLAALLGADAVLLAVALAINLASLLAKGWAWHLLFRPAVRGRWQVSQEANLVGSAVNSLSVSVVGEAARMHYVTSHDGVPPATVAASILGSRAVEALGLALFVLGMPLLGSLPPLVRWIQIGAVLSLVLAVVTLILRGRGRRKPPRFLPRVVRSMLVALVDMGSLRRIAVPTLLAVASWITQWGTYHLVLLAIGVSVTPAASVTALIITNIGGLLRITPANVGVTQAAMTVSLLPFGVPPEQAVAAGLALQGIQVLPVLALAMALVGWKGLRQEAAGSGSTPGN
jgi:uncharacterized membrane protein YbhN (UPF0104 family)